MTPPETPELRDHWRQGLQTYLERRARVAALRAELAAARAAGKRARHATRLAQLNRAAEKPRATYGERTS